MKWTILIIVVGLLVGLALYPEETKQLIGFAIWGTKTLTGFAIKYGPDIINKTAPFVG